MFWVRRGAAEHNRFSATIFKPPMGALLPGALVSLAVIGSPARFDSFTASGVSFPNFAFCCGVAGGAVGVWEGRPDPPGRLREIFPGFFPGAAGISPARQNMYWPSLVGRP